MSDASATPPLSTEDFARLLAFARAFKAAARAVALYPSSHPAIPETLQRIVDLTSSRVVSSPIRLTVLPDALLLDDQAPPRGDSALTELAELLHGHLIGTLTVHPGGSIEDWQAFLLLLSRSPETLRAEGGIGHVWATASCPHVDVREIDYAEILRERPGGEAAKWARLVDWCLAGSVGAPPEDDDRDVRDVGANADRLSELLRELEARTGPASALAHSRPTVLRRTLRALVDSARHGQPDQLESVLTNMARAVGQLSPDTLIELLSTHSGGTPEDGALGRAVVRRMAEDVAVQFVTRNVITAAPTEHLAEAFQLLVGESDTRRRLIDLAHRDLAASPLGSTDGFEGAWQQIAATLLASPASGHDGRPADAWTRATSVERAGEDPPERIAGWLTTVAASAMRTLDLALVLDLLRIETRDDRWGELMAPIVALLEDLLLVGDFDAAGDIVDVLVREAASGTSTTRRQSAMTAIDMLVAGSMMRSVVTHLATIDDRQFAHVKALCVSLGEVLVKPLAEALALEENGRAHERLTSIVLAFGAIGRRTAERLKRSPNAAVRRTAIYLLREFGGNEALPDLTELLADNEPQVQREAVRAILNIGTERAYEILEQALARGTTVSRDAIMQAMIGMRGDRAAPLFAYILRHTDHRGPLAPIYLRAIESLGVLRDPDGVLPLNEALYRGEWWAPRRSALFRSAAAAALARIGTPEAQAVLEGAATKGPRGVRSAARAQLHLSASRTHERREKDAR